MRVTCSICMDCFDRKNIDNVNATACGHVFHELCLLHWHGMSKTCPTCRKPLRSKQIFKLFFNASETRGVDVDNLQNQLDDAKAQVRAAGVENIKLQETADTLKAFLVQREDEVQKFKDKYMTAIGDRNLLESKLRSMMKEVAEKRMLSDENMVLRSRVTDYENLRKLMDSTAKEAEALLKSYGGNGFETQKQLATYCCLLKRELQSTKVSKTNMADEVTRLIKETGHWTARAKHNVLRLKALEAEVAHLKSLLQDAEKRIQVLKEERRHDHTLLDHTLLEESPAPERRKRPRMTNPEDTLTPGVPSPSYKIVTSALKFKPDHVLTPTRVPLVACDKNFFRPGSSSSSPAPSIIRTGYNGLGGHSKHVVGSKALPKRL